MHSLIDLRAEQERQLRKLLKKQDIRDIQKRLRRAEGSVNLSSIRDPLTVARQMLGTVPVPKGPADEETLHRYRLVVKRARYAAEFAPKSPESIKFLTELKRAQDALGNWHDWLTLTHTAIGRLGDVNQSSLVAVLYNVTRGKFRHAVSAVMATKNESRGARPGATKLQPAGKTAPAARKHVGTDRRRGAAA
jgi:CHAD domain-containing protein